MVGGWGVDGGEKEKRQTEGEHRERKKTLGRKRGRERQEKGQKRMEGLTD